MARRDHSPRRRRRHRCLTTWALAVTALALALVDTAAAAPSSSVESRAWSDVPSAAAPPPPPRGVSFSSKTWSFVATSAGAPASSSDGNGYSLVGPAPNAPPTTDAAAKSTPPPTLASVRAELASYQLAIVHGILQRKSLAASQMMPAAAAAVAAPSSSDHDDAEYRLSLEQLSSDALAPLRTSLRDALPQRTDLASYFLDDAYPLPWLTQRRDEALARRWGDVPQSDGRPSDNTTGPPTDASIVDFVFGQLIPGLDGLAGASAGAASGGNDGANATAQAQPRADPLADSLRGLSTTSLLTLLASRTSVGQRVALAKFAANATTYCPAVLDSDAATIRKHLTDPTQERSVVESVARQVREASVTTTNNATTTSTADEPSAVVVQLATQLFAKFLIPVTTDVEVATLLGMADEC